MSKLQLALKAEYFDAIKAGAKMEEYRLYNAYWTKRLYTYDPFGPNPAVFDSIVLTRGYPKRGDPERTLERQWKGFTTRTITHPHFGPDPVSVYVIDVSTPATQPKPLPPSPPQLSDKDGGGLLDRLGKAIDRNVALDVSMMSPEMRQRYRAALQEKEAGE